MMRPALHRLACAIAVSVLLQAQAGTHAHGQLVEAATDYRDRARERQPALDAEVDRAARAVEAVRHLVAERAATRDELADAERALAAARERAAAGREAIADVERLIAEATAEPEPAEAPEPVHATVAWSLARVRDVERFFVARFGRALPVSAYGQSGVHDRFRLDHRNSIDVAVRPDSVEGAATIDFLRANGIPFRAFRGAIPGVATGAHIHIGYPSRRY